MSGQHPPISETHADDLVCRELVELVTDYLEDALPADTRAHFEAHLSVCSACREYLGQLRRTVSVLGHLNDRPLAAAERTTLLALFRGWRDSSAGGSAVPDTR